MYRAFLNSDLSLFFMLRWLSVPRELIHWASISFSLDSYYELTKLPEFPLTEISASCLRSVSLFCSWLFRFDALWLLQYLISLSRSSPITALAVLSSAARTFNLSSTFSSADSIFQWWKPITSSIAAWFSSRWRTMVAEAPHILRVIHHQIKRTDWCRLVLFFRFLVVKYQRRLGPHFCH